MNATQELLNHPFWKASDPSRMRLVRISQEFPPEMNPFAAEGVSIRMAGVPGEAPHSKFIVAREGILYGIRNGFIHPKKKIVEATSGNTGHGMALACQALQLYFMAVMSGDVPNDKIDVIRAFGQSINVHVHSDPDETTVAYARRLGTQEDWHNPDQYAGEWNWLAHCTHLAPQLFDQAGKVSVLVAPAGTMGTCMGLAAHAKGAGLSTIVVPVVCGEANGETEEVPGARTLRSIREDIRLPWRDYFRESDIEFATRHASFLLSFLSWRHVSQMLGPSSGLGIAGAYRFLQRHAREGTLNQFRDRDDGKIRVVVFGPDDYRPYLALYRGELKKKELSAKIPPSDLLSILEK